MVSRDVQEAIRSDALLGEGPRWDAATGRLLWVDIERGLLHVSDPGSGEDRAIALGARVGAAAPTDTGDVLVALAHRLALVDLASESVRSLAAFPHDEDVRTNDGACDPAGRFWIGTNALDFAPGRRRAVPLHGRRARADARLGDALERPRLVARRTAHVLHRLAHVPDRRLRFRRR